MTAPLPQSLNTADPFVLYGESFASRLLLGTSRYPSPQVLENAVKHSNPGMITVSLRRQGSSTVQAHSGFWDLLKKMAVPVLPNTAGCHSPQEAITTAQ
ncbi:MAG: thiazole synthase, partial [Polynucleobacter sp. 24-46-87]